MSWNSYTLEPQDRDEKLNMTMASQQGEGIEESFSDQFNAAVQAFTLLAAAVGRPEDKIRIHISGHANPDHGPKEGWGPEFITVTVTAVPE